jgi:hypothetical protein
MPETPDARLVVATAVQDLVAARLGRGFVPLAVLFAVGVVELFVSRGGGALVLCVGAVGAACAMLAYGLRTAQRAFARPPRAWMAWVTVGTLVPPAFALYVLAWRGLRQLATGGDASGFGVGIAFAVMGTWLMRTWMKVVEVERLAQVMTMDIEGGV